MRTAHFCAPCVGTGTLTPDGFSTLERFMASLTAEATRATNDKALCDLYDYKFQHLVRRTATHGWCTPTPCTFP